MPDRILVTGGAGFVGSTVALELKSRFSGADVVAFDNLRRRGSELNLPRLRAAGVRFVHGDVRNPADLQSVAPDLLVECSAEPSVQSGYSGSPQYVVETNLIGCYNCLELMRQTKGDFIFLSTSRVYPFEQINALRFREGDSRFLWQDEQGVAGTSPEGISEGFPLTGVRSVYGMTKLAAELMVQEYGAAYGFRYVINRFGLIAGPWQMGKSDQGVITLWVAAHHFRRPLKYIGFGGMGKQVRDVMHVDDASDLIARQAGMMGHFNGQTFNAGGGTRFSLSLREATALCERLVRQQTDITSDPEARRADVRIYITDARKLEQFCGWTPQRSPETTLQDTVLWIRRHEAQVAPYLVGLPI